jgi:hypothetical protein
MSQRVQTGGLQVAEVLYNFVNNQVIPGTGVTEDQFWSGLDAIVHDLAPKNRELLAKRDAIQEQIDAWHRERQGQALDFPAYKSFLQEIGYLLPEGEDFSATTSNVDPEMATMAGPQLVVPVMNARFALNAANAAGAVCTMLFMVPMRFPMTTAPNAQAVTIRPGVQKSLNLPATSLMKQRLWQMAVTRILPVTLFTTASWSSPLQMVLKPACKTKLSWPATTASQAHRQRFCWDTTACTLRSRSTVTARSDQAMPLASVI